MHQSIELHCKLGLRHSEILNLLSKMDAINISVHPLRKIFICLGFSCDYVVPSLLGCGVFGVAATNLSRSVLTAQIQKKEKRNTSAK